MKRSALSTTVPVQFLTPGQRRVRWDGRDRSGVRAAPGVYFMRMRGADGGSRAVRVLLVR